MMIAAYVGGWMSTSVATIIIIVCRLTLYPVSYSALINIVVLSVSAVAFSMICHSNMNVQRKWSFMAASFILILSVGICFVIPDVTTVFSIFGQYVFSIICGIYATYKIKYYLWRNDEHHAKLKEGSEKDFLTGLNNLRSFKDAIQTAFINAKEHQHDLSLLVIDIDYFKNVNDTYGHPTGDEVLKQIAHILVQSCRVSDIASRNGGEEFSVIMPACDAESALTIAKRIRHTVEQSVFLINTDLELKVTVSIGYATINPKNMISVEEFFSRADEALYNAKRMGRNRVGTYSNLKNSI